MSRKLLFSLAVFLVFGTSLLVIGELVLRSMAPRSDPVTAGLRLPHSSRQYGLIPNTRSVQTGVDVATNSLGFREKEYPAEKPPGVRRIVVLGDSFTLGVGVEFADIFTKRLERQLNQSGGRYEVINFAVSGYNTVLELATFREVAAAFRPDLVIVAYVLNDVEQQEAFESAPTSRPSDLGSLLTRVHLFMKDESLLYGYLSPRIGTVLGFFGARYAVGKTHEIIRSYDESSPGWIDSRQALLGIAGEARRIGASVLIVVFPMMIDFATYPLAPAHATVTQFCRSHDLPVLDLLPRFAGQDASRLTVFLDGHPNAEAHRAFADAIFDHLVGGDPTPPRLEVFAP